ncbi:MAG: hypothetical protein AAGA48_41100 [Myxococcota bacterium]
MLWMVATVAFVTAAEAADEDRWQRTVDKVSTAVVGVRSGEPPTGGGAENRHNEHHRGGLEAGEGAWG